MVLSFFLKKNHLFLVYIHCLYIDKWHNSRYSFNNLIIIFHRFLHRMNWRLLVSIERLICILSMKFDPCLGPRVWITMSYENVPRRIREIPDHLKTQEKCDEAVCNNPYILRHVSDHFKTQEMCEEAVEASPWQLKYVPDQYKAQKMCDEGVIDDSSSLQYVPD